MPYIPEYSRVKINTVLADITNYVNAPGELNYAVTRIILNYLDGTDKSYSDYNELIGVLDCVKQEFYRRVVATYENQKMDQNGDVY